MDSQPTLTKLVDEVFQVILDTNGDLSEILDKNSSELQEQSWTVITHLNELLQEVELTPAQCRMAGLFFDFMCNNGNPKELAFAFIESCDAFKNSALYHEIVPFLTKVLLKLPRKQQSLDIVCGTLYGHIKALAWTSQEYCITENEANPGIVSPVKKDLKTDQMLSLVSTFTVHLLSPIAESCIGEAVDDSTRQLLSMYLLQLLHYPLLYIHYDKQDETSVDCISHVVNTIVTLYPTLTNPIGVANSQSSPAFSMDYITDNPVEQAMAAITDEDLLPGAANLAYLIFWEQLADKAVPLVWSKQHRLVVLLPSLGQLYLRSANTIVALKATRLLLSLLNNIGSSVLTTDFLELPQVKYMVTFLCWSMQHNELLTVRQASARLLPVLIEAFNHKARFHFFQSILNNEKSPEILSYVYTLVKDFIHECWHMENYEEGSAYGLALMEKIFQVPDGEDGKLIEDLNKISSALNLARYLVMRDKNRSAPYTKEMNKYILSYIKPVGQCLQSELKTLEVELVKIDSGEYSPAEMSINIGDETVENSLELEREAITSSISRIQIVIFVHDCLTEALNS